MLAFIRAAIVSGTYNNITLFDTRWGMCNSNAGNNTLNHQYHVALLVSASSVEQYRTCALHIIQY